MEKSMSARADIKYAEELSEFDASSEDILALFERRLEQSRASRLCEYVTGLPLEDLEMLRRAFYDHHTIRGKYGLLHEDVVVNDSVWYENYLRAIAEREGVEITDKSNCGNFFEKNPAAAVYFPESKRAGVTIDKSRHRTYVQSLAFLEHEIIHAIQFNNTPSMPVELMEYEAYIAGSDSYCYLESTFEGMSRSVVHWYGYISEKTEEPITPEWDSADFFIENVDGIVIETLPESTKEAFEAMKQEIKSAKRWSQPNNKVVEIDLGTIDFLNDTEDIFELREITEHSGL